MSTSLCPMQQFLLMAVFRLLAVALGHVVIISNWSAADDLHMSNDDWALATEQLLLSC